MESISNIKCENIEIKSEESYRDSRLQNLKYEPFDFTNTKLLTNYLKVKEEFEDICDETAVESRSDINFEYVAIKSEKDYSGCSLQNLKVEPAHCTNKYQSEYVKPTDNSTLKRKDKLCDLKDEHLELKHRVSETIFKCNSCHYETHRKRNFTHHQHKHVPEEQMFKCDSCNYRTAYRNHHKRHQRLHNTPEEQMHKCDSCDYKTIFKRFFVQHQLRHKDIPEDQIYRCNLCDYKTISMSCLNRHHITH